MAQNRDPYRIWISEIMLQQTRVAGGDSLLRTISRAISRRQSTGGSSAGRSPAFVVRPRLLQPRAQSAKSRATNRGKARWRISPRAPQKCWRFPESANTPPPRSSASRFDDKQAVLDGNVARVIARLEAIRGDLREPAAGASCRTAQINCCCANPPATGTRP